jgi:cell division septation protein DedD
MLKKMIALMLVILFVFACGKKEKEEYPDVKLGQSEEEIREEAEFEQDIPDHPQDTSDVSIQEEAIKPDEPIEKPQTISYQAGDYEVQLLSLRDHSRILRLQEVLKNHGYETKILETYKDGQLLYRLRLKERYTKETATELGEEIKAKFSEITSYWVQKVR